MSQPELIIMNTPITELEAYRKANEISEIFRASVREAHAETRRLGVANVYSLNGQHYYELPNVDYTRISPWGPETKSS